MSLIDTQSQLLKTTSVNVPFLDTCLEKYRKYLPRFFLAVGDCRRRAIVFLEILKNQHFQSITGCTWQKRNVQLGYCIIKFMFLVTRPHGILIALPIFHYHCFHSNDVIIMNNDNKPPALTSSRAYFLNQKHGFINSGLN